MNIFISYPSPTSESPPLAFFTARELATHLITTAGDIDETLTDINDTPLACDEAALTAHLESGLAVYIGDCLEVGRRVALTPNDESAPSDALGRLLASNALLVEGVFTRTFTLPARDLMTQLQSGQRAADSLCEGERDAIALHVPSHEGEAFIDITLDEMLHATALQEDGTFTVDTYVEGNPVKFCLEPLLCR